MTGPAPKIAPANIERRVPPHSPEAEMAVLGGILLRNEALDQVRDRLDEEDFYVPAHRRLFTAICALYDRADNIDPVTLRDELKTRNWLDDIGGTAYIERLLDEVHTTANIEQYARIVAEKALLRRMLDATYHIQGMVFDGRDDDGSSLAAEQVLDRSQQLVFEVARDTVKSPYESLEEVVSESLSYVEERMKHGHLLAGASTGFTDLDDKTNGVKPGELIILAARPGMGKTSLALNMAAHLTGQLNLPVLMFSLEMNAVQIGLRLLASVAKVPLNRLFRGDLPNEDYQRVAAAAGYLAEKPLYVDDGGGTNVNTIRSKARRLRSEMGPLGLIIIDYIQMLGTVNRFESREREIASISRHLKLIAKELECPVLALSQLNRQLENRPDKRPKPSDLRESGSLEQDADLILFIYRDSAYWTPEDWETKEDPMKTELIIGKQRSGPTGKVDLTFRDDITTFLSYTDRTAF